MLYIFKTMQCRCTPLSDSLTKPTHLPMINECGNKNALFPLSIYYRLERDAKLGALEERADALQDGCAQFEKQAAAMKNKFWLENMKAMIAGGVVGLILLGLLYWKFFMDTGPQYPYPPPGYAPPPPPPPQAPAPAASDAGGDSGGDDGGDAGGSE